jgi:hypothetical protein
MLIYPLRSLLDSGIHSYQMFAQKFDTNIKFKISKLFYLRTLIHFLHIEILVRIGDLAAFDCPLLTILFGFLWSSCSNGLLSCFAFHSFDLWCVWWRLCQKRVVRTKLDISIATISIALIEILLDNNSNYVSIS